MNLSAVATFLQQQPSGQGGALGLVWTFLPLLLIFAIFYFLLILPQQRRQRRWTEMLNNLKNGDDVITSGGIKGRIVNIKEDVVNLQVPPDGLRIQVLRTAIVSIADKTS